MRLRIWVEEDPLSADAPDTPIHVDIELRGEWTLPEARALAISFAQQAHTSLTNREGARAD
jgi:hypothetical protein